jgi:hypothetical protein
MRTPLCGVYTCIYCCTYVKIGHMYAVEEKKVVSVSGILNYGRKRFAKMSEKSLLYCPGFIFTSKYLHISQKASIFETADFPSGES